MQHARYAFWQPAWGNNPFYKSGYRTQRGLRALPPTRKSSRSILSVCSPGTFIAESHLPESCPIPDNATDQSLTVWTSRQFRSAASEHLHRRIVACTIGLTCCSVEGAANTRRSQSSVVALSDCRLD